MNKKHNSIHDTVRQPSIARGCLPVPAVMPGRHRCWSDASRVADLLAMASPGWGISPSNWSWDEFGGAGPITRQGLQAIFPNSLFFLCVFPFIDIENNGLMGSHWGCEEASDSMCHPSDSQETRKHQDRRNAPAELSMSIGCIGCMPTDYLVDLPIQSLFKHPYLNIGY